MSSIRGAQLPSRGPAHCLLMALIAVRSLPLVECGQLLASLALYRCGLGPAGVATTPTRPVSPMRAKQQIVRSDVGRQCRSEQLDRRLP